MNIVERERGQYPKVKVASIPVTCMHCDDAPCVAKAKGGAVYKRKDGIVIIDPVKAKGQKQIVDACPYGVVFWNKEESVPQKCTMCAHLLDRGWKEPRCAEACPTGALIFGDLDDAASEVAKALEQGQAEVLYPEKGVRARTRYIGLPRKFVAGTVQLADVNECAESATVTIRAEGFERIAVTNVFGDFEFEGLADDTKFAVLIEKAGYKPQTLTAVTDRDVYLGKILLERVG